MRTHKHLSLQLLWEEYRAAQPGGYRYSYFCELYRKWKAAQGVVLRQEHRAGEKLFVDWAGATIPLYEAGTGEITEWASLFVAALGGSSYTFAQAALRQDLGTWIDCHVRALEFFGGCPTLIIPDNPRTAVNRACRYEPDLNRTYLEMAQHYGVAILPARPRKPRDKAKVESAVGVVERWIVAALRHRKFFSLAELNGAIAELLERLNQRPFRKREGTRASLFAELDRPALKPLPLERYCAAEWKTCRANIDYHTHHNGPQYFGYIANNPKMTQNLHGLGDFFSAVDNKTLPAEGGVFWVKGGYTNTLGPKPAMPDPKVQANFLGDDDHPAYSDAQISEAMVAEAINKIAASGYWENSAIIILYDDSEGDLQNAGLVYFYSYDPADPQSALADPLFTLSARNPNGSDYATLLLNGSTSELFESATLGGTSGAPLATGAGLSGVPEPAALPLALVGGAALFLVARRRRIRG